MELAPSRPLAGPRRAGRALPPRSLAPPIGQPRQRGGKRTGLVFRRHFIFDACAGNTRERRQRQRELLGNRLAGIDHGPDDRLEGDIVVDGPADFLLRLGRSVMEGELLRDRAPDRIEGDDAALDEGGVKGGARRTNLSLPKRTSSTLAESRSRARRSKRRASAARSASLALMSWRNGSAPSRASGTGPREFRSAAPVVPGHR